MRRIPAAWPWIWRERSHRPTATNAASVTTAATMRETLVRRQLMKQPPVALDGDRPVGLGNHVRSAAASHLLQVVAPVVGRANRLRDELRPVWGRYLAAADRLYDRGCFAVGVGGNENGPSGREDTVQPARDDVAGEPAPQPDIVQVRGGERGRKRLARLVVEEAHGVRLQPLGELDELGAPRSSADDHHRKVFEVAEERRRADENVEVLRVADVARVHHDELVDEPVLASPFVLPWLRNDGRGVDPVGDDRDPLRLRSLLLQPPPHSLSDRDDAVGTTKV